MSLLEKAQPRILIVDDEPANLKVLRQVLQDSYRLSFARSGEAALEVCLTEEETRETGDTHRHERTDTADEE